MLVISAVSELISHDMWYLYVIGKSVYMFIRSELVTQPAAPSEFPQNNHAACRSVHVIKNVGFKVLSLGPLR